MLRYVGSRLLWAAIIIVGIVAVNFVLTRILPGNPVNALVGDFPVPQEYVDQVRRELGLDRPMVVQLGRYLVQLAQGNLGFSFVNRQPVLPLLLDRAGVTLMLMIPSLILASLLGVFIAVRAARSAGSALNTFLTALSLAGVSIPVFWLAQLLIMQFSINLGWLPAQGMTSVRANHTGFAWFLDYLQHLILPAFCITISYMAVVIRVARSSMLEMLDQDFILTARAKGLQRIGGAMGPRPAQRPDPGHHGDRLQFRLFADRRDPDRDGVRLARPRRAVRQLDRIPRLSRAVGNLPAGRHGRRVRQSDHRYHVRGRRSARAPGHHGQGLKGRRAMPESLRRVLQNPVGVASAAVILFLLAVAAFGPLVYVSDPFELTMEATAPPGGVYPFGTDDLGRDVLAGLIEGVKVSLFVGCAAAFAATVLGVAIGAIAGYLGGWVDTVIMRIAEFFQVMPTFILSVLIVSLLGPGLLAHRHRDRAAVVAADGARRARRGAARVAARFRRTRRAAWAYPGRASCWAR